MCRWFSPFAEIFGFCLGSSNWASTWSLTSSITKSQKAYPSVWKIIVFSPYHPVSLLWYTYKLLYIGVTLLWKLLWVIGIQNYFGHLQLSGLIWYQSFLSSNRNFLEVFKFEWLLLAGVRMSMIIYVCCVNKTTFWLFYHIWCQF